MASTSGCVLEIFPRANSNMTNSRSPKLSLIVAMAKNRVIGRDNELPWRLKSDLQRFKKTTMGKPIVMGRKTWESLGRPLPGRLNVVISRQSEYALPDGVALVNSIDEAITLVAEQQPNITEVMVIGGAELYRQTLKRADTLYLSVVDANIEGDAYFPEFDAKQWQEVKRESVAADADNEFSHDFFVLERIAP